MMIPYLNLNFFIQRKRKKFVKKTKKARRKNNLLCKTLKRVKKCKPKKQQPVIKSDTLLILEQQIEKENELPWESEKTYLMNPYYYLEESFFEDLK